MMLRVCTVLMALLLSTSAFADKRVALVVGNFEYVDTNISDLSNPGNDARRIAQILVQRGFRLVGNGPLINIDKRTFDRAVSAYGQMAQDADVTFFYYSGHGMQVNGTNFLLPSDAPTPAPYNLRTSFMSADIVMSAIDQAHSRLNFFLLDACRNNPFKNNASKAGQSGDGFAQMQAPIGTVIGFATQPGNTASDGAAITNSPYAQALYEVMQKPGLDQFRLLNDTAVLVTRRTNGEQRPWMSASPITESFYMTPPLVNPSVSDAAPATPALANVMPPPAPLPQPSTQVAALGNSFAYVPTTPGVVSTSYTQRANELFEQSNYLGGRSVLTAGINAGQRTAIMYSYRGYSWLQDGLNRPNLHEQLAYFRAGFPDLDAAISTERAYPNSYRHRGNMITWTYKALVKTGQHTYRILDKAVEDLTMAVRLDPASFSNAYYLGEAYNLRGESGDYDQAIYWFRKALELKPTFVAPHSGMCYAYRKKGDMTNASREGSIALNKDRDQTIGSCLTAEAWNRYVPKF